jgi:hypothetical protein
VSTGAVTVPSTSAAVSTAFPDFAAEFMTGFFRVGDGLWEDRRFSNFSPLA